ncbi:unnamed protein product [Parascedosporium putredinis]|nr:unnamed protein product [Parascedosporium putredinis]CAI7990375.1 unnamed protein product [Parascedosporium putredinis]
MYDDQEDQENLQEDANMAEAHPADGENVEEEEPESQDDLVSLPDDVANLPPLLAGAAAPGMVITWKRWLLSKATQWQPQVSDVTAVVISVENGDTLHVLLAKRDRALDKPEKTYDPDTGKRIYEPFECPDDVDSDDNEGDQGADDGALTVKFGEMMEPRVVQEPPESESQMQLPDSLPSEKGSTGGEAIGDATELMSLDLQVPLSDPFSTGDGNNEMTELPPSSQPNASLLKVPEHSQNTTSLDVTYGLEVAGSVASGCGQPDPNFVGVESYDSQDDAIPDSAPGLEAAAVEEQVSKKPPHKKNSQAEQTAKAGENEAEDEDEFPSLFRLVSSSLPVEWGQRCGPEGAGGLELSRRRRYPNQPGGDSAAGDYGELLR